VGRAAEPGGEDCARYFGHPAGGYARYKQASSETHQPEYLLRSIWAEARRNHRAGQGQHQSAAADRTSAGEPSSAALAPITAAVTGRTPQADRDQRADIPAQPADRYGTGYPRWLSIGLAAAAGLALAGAFPPAGFWPLAIAGPALLTAALWRKRPWMAFGLGLISGGVFFFALLSWLINVAWYAWIALAVIETLIFAVLAVALPLLMRLPFWPLAVAGWWVAQEAVRDRFPWGGFGWGRLAMSQASAPTAGWATIGGLPVLTFLLALSGACAAYLIITVPRLIRESLSAQSADAPPTDLAASNAASARRGRRAMSAVFAFVFLSPLVLLGNQMLVWVPGPGPSAVVATIQGNVPHSRNLPDQLRATTVTANHAAATEALAAAVKAGHRPAPDIVIWPENSTDIDPSSSLQTFDTISLAVAAIGRPVLVGAVLSNPQRNAGQLWRPNRGPTQLYVKRKLVPFGEVIPYRHFLELFTSLPKLQPHDFTPGHKAVVFGAGKVRLGDVICYEVGFDNLVRSEVMAGANLLAVQTNDADFELDGQTGETEQQLEMARMDAITTGRSVAVASTIGVSALIEPNGAILAQTKTWQRAELDARLPLVSDLTPADQAGDWPELIIVALTAAALLAAAAAGAAGRFRSARPARPAGESRS
jgi:apolipoprotein N-acyltransferase